ncbi:MAG: DUF4160 domain-containing protein [Phycisphaeraceae bacterium]
MPKILEVGPYRFYFYSRELNEPPHVHVRRDRFEAKYWLDPVELAQNRRFSRRELNRIEALIRDHRDGFLERWHGYFGSQD